LVSRVLDATAFYAGIPFSSQSTHYVTTLVFDEIKHIKKNHNALQILIDSNRLLVRQPQADFQERVEKCAQKTGDIHSLSKQDISCIALSLELNTELISDDFAVLNVSNKLGINTIPLMTNGIKVVGKWIFYCPACKKDFSDEKNCLLCGNKLKKKLVKSKY
jgi:UPF0271 protein|tara:strand:+ start:349 stop:834 length:486 start_codon:yes stop_codon:yes gene_type:complete